MKKLLSALVVAATLALSVFSFGAADGEKAIHPMIFVAIFSVPAAGLVFVAVFFIVKRHKKAKAEKARKEAEQREMYQPAPPTPKSQTINIDARASSSIKKGQTQALFSEPTFFLDISIREPGREPRRATNLRGKTTIGRDPDNGIVIEDRTGTVSGHQCMIEIASDGAYITQIGSTNPTYIDEKPVGRTREKMPPSSTLKMGMTELAVEVRLQI